MSELAFGALTGLIDPDRLTAQSGLGSTSTATMVLVSVTAVLIGGAGAWSLRQRDQDRANLMRMAMSDDLTQLANRRRLDLDLDNHATSGGPITVAMLDIDLFKSLNDRQGHVFGDEVIRKVAATIAANVRSGDVVYRYGGEEFCVLMPGATEEQAFHVIDRIRRIIGEIDYSVCGETVTVSGGVSMGPGHLARANLRSADDALFRAKRHGRNQVVVA